YLDHLPVLSLQPEQVSRYRLRRSTREDHLCTAEVAALCLELAGETQAAEALGDHFELFTRHYLAAKHRQPLDTGDELHRRRQVALQALPVAGAVAPAALRWGHSWASSMPASMMPAPT